MSRAWKTAASGRPGPVVVVLPEDVLSEFAQTQSQLIWPKVRGLLGVNDQMQHLDPLFKLPVLILIGKAIEPKLCTVCAETNHSCCLCLAVS